MDLTNNLVEHIYQGSGNLIELDYSPVWVLFSVLLAISGTFVATAIAGISGQLHHPITRWTVQFTGALAFGASVWGMHFVGMLAVSMPVQVTYDPITTLISVLPATLAAWVAIHWLALEQTSWSKQLVTAGFIAVGIGTMHYTGMYAMRMDAELQFEPQLFILSLLIAYLLSLISIQLVHTLRNGANNYKHLGNLAGGVGFGLSIAAMHYVAMLSTRVVGVAALDIAIPPTDRGHLISLITLGLLAALGISYAGSLATRLRINNRELTLRREQLKQIIQHSMNSVFTIGEDGQIETVNAQSEHLFREPNTSMCTKNIREYIPDWHPDIEELELTGVHDRECIGRRSDGQELQLLLRKSMLNIEGKKLFIIFLMDISEYKETEKELYHQATHDALTGAFNRRHMESVIISEYQRCRRHHNGLSVMMFDIDHFKRVNDTYGHDIGDQVLSEVANRLQQLIRASDTLCRTGGEEFLLILPETNNPAALVLAERLRARIANEPFHLDSGHKLNVTISIGVYTTLGESSEGYQEVIQRADRAMYAAKTNGRDRVENYTNLLTRGLGAVKS